MKKMICLILLLLVSYSNKIEDIDINSINERINKEIHEEIERAYKTLIKEETKNQIQKLKKVKKIYSDKTFKNGFTCKLWGAYSMKCVKRKDGKLRVVIYKYIYE